MRLFFFTIAIATVALLSSLWVAPERVQRAYFQVTDLLRSELYQRELRYQGVSEEREFELTSLLPLERSNVWWASHVGDVADVLRRDPHVLDAVVSRCSGWSLACFDIEITTRAPKLFAQVGETVWSVGEDGGLISPLPRERFAALHSHPLVRGLAVANLSPEVVRARLSYVRSALEIIREVSGLEVGQVDMRRNGELEVAFRGATFTTVFEADDHRLKTIREEAKRLREVLTRFEGDPAQLKRIDLAFQRVAVVELHDESVTGEGEQPSGKS